MLSTSILLVFAISSLVPDCVLGFSLIKYRSGTTRATIVASSIRVVPQPSRKQVGIAPSTSLKQQKGDDSHDDKSSPQVMSSVSFGLVAADLLAVCIACQLLGLLDVLADSDFWKNGGWFQPIPVAPSSLPTLVQRLSINSIVYFGIAVPLGVCNPQTSDDAATTDSSSIVGSLIRWAPLFLLIRVVTSILLATFLVSSPSGLEQQLPTTAVLECLRECYFVVLSIAGARYVYSLLY